MTMITLLLITLYILIDWAQWKEVMIGALAIIGALIVWKSGLVQNLTGSQKSLIDSLKEEIKTCKEKVAELQSRIKELEEYNRLLILNSRTTMEVAIELDKLKKTKKEKPNE